MNQVKMSALKNLTSEEFSVAKNLCRRNFMPLYANGTSATESTWPIFRKVLLQVKKEKFIDVLKKLLILKAEY